MPLLDGTADVQPDLPGRFPLFDAVDGVLEDLTRERPVVLLLDDVHWVDEGSLRLLQFLTADLPSRALLGRLRLAGPRRPGRADQEQLAGRGSPPAVSRGCSDGLPEHDVGAAAGR